MSSKAVQIEKLKREFGNRPFRVSEAIEAGASRTTLHRLHDDGELESPSRGMLQFPGGGLGMLSDLALVSAQAPRATICLNSALSYWDLTDEIPSAIHIAIPQGTRKPRFSELRIEQHVFNAKNFRIDRVKAETDIGEPFWIYSAERSIVDSLRMARWVGRDVGLHALRRYMQKPGARPGRMIQLANEIGGARAIAPALEAILS